MNSPNVSGGASLLRDIAHQAMIDRGLEPDFPADAKAQSDAITGPGGDADASIKDLTNLLWSSIDNDDSLDLDQIEVAESLADGAIKVLVGIADVDVLVPLGCPIDKHASTNTTSVYTSAQIFPMLPQKLSTNLTSLMQDQVRLAIVIEYVVAADGSLGATSVYRARVRNRAKLAYNSTAAWLEGTGPAPAPLAAVAGMDEQLRMQDRAAQALRKVRHDHGALTLETIQTRAVFDGEALASMQPDEPNRAKKLIEDFMIAANGVTARLLADRNVAALRRVVRTPKRWGRIVELARGLGENLPDQPDAVALNGFLAHRRQADPTHFPDLSLSVIKLMGAGEYVVEAPGQPAPGHFGLAVQDYTHSTAPNRRYPDVITQRLLKATLAGKSSPYTVEQLQSLAQHCTDQEDNADKVERQVSKSAAAMLLSNSIGKSFHAIVTGASDKGTYVRIDSPPVEGRVTRGFKGLDVGASVTVKLLSTDIRRGYIDFAAGA